MLSERHIFSLKSYVWGVIAIFFLFAFTFVLYVRSEKWIDTTNEIRLESHEITRELKQSSDDLTRMARSYVMTKNPMYKNKFEKIIDIRDGKASRPLHNGDLYVELSGMQNPLLRLEGPAESVIEMIRKAGFTKEEIKKLESAKVKSDELVVIEREAMRLIEGDPVSEANTKKAIGLLFSPAYDVAKAKIMLPILEAHQLMEKRTNEAVEDARMMADIMRLIFVITGMILFFVLWRAYMVWSKLYTVLDSAKKKAEAAEEIKSGFMANMSHEIRTPLNGIVGFVNLLSKSPLNTEQSRYISIVQNSIESLLVIVNDILDFSKIAEGKKEVELLDVNLKSECEKAFLLFEPRAKDKQIDYTLSIDPALAPCVRLDMHLTKQVMLNLINNAIKFTSEKGEIRIRISVAKDGVDSQTLLFEVQDNGVGISKENVNTIFDKFTQADVSTTRTYGGTGLGLSIAYSLVQMMGGELTVQSEEGKGSLFSFALTVEKCLQKIKVANSLSTELAMTDPFIAPELSVLVAEDQDTNQMLINEYLKRYQIRADFAANGEEAVGMATQKLYDLILMDINMPVMDGIEATRLIRQSYPDILVVALTANALEGDYEKFMEAGMNEYLIKPINIQALESILRYANSMKQ